MVSFCFTLVVCWYLYLVALSTKVPTKEEKQIIIELMNGPYPLYSYNINIILIGVIIIYLIS